MSEIDYSKKRSIVDERHWDAFVKSVGGEPVSPLILRQGVKNADYLFRSDKVIAELKVLETEFAHSREMLARVDALIARYPDLDPDDPTQPLRGELLRELKKPLQRIINKANRQIKETKAELGMQDHQGVLICVNDSFRSAPPGLVMGLIGSILSGTSYRSISAVIYQTNHLVELIESPYAVLLWAPMYSPHAGSHLVDFVNNLGRKWRTYAESIEGPYDINSETPHLRLEEATVVSGVYRNRRFES
jgi:hypothetical protein